MRVSISGLKDPVFQAALALNRAQDREYSGKFLVEGEIVNKALADDTVLLDGVFATRDECDRIEEQCSRRGITLYETSSGLISKLVGTGYDTSVKSVAVIWHKLIDWVLVHEGGRPTVSNKPSVVAASLSEVPCLLIGERIQDPRNLGVLVRTAEAAGCGALVLSRDSADAYCRAAVRSSTGSIMRMPVVVFDDIPFLLRTLRERGTQVVATSIDAPNIAYHADLSRRPLAVVMGNEGTG